MTRAIKKHIGDFAAIVALVAVAIGATGYIILNQDARPAIPFVEDKPIPLKAEFSDAQAVTPGQGQSVRVAGVEVGKISKVELEDGMAVVTMDVQPKYAGKVRKDASALLRPRTGLKDMFIELDPGTQTAERLTPEDRIGSENTAPDIDPDEILQALDTDTRSYLQLLVNGLGKGLKNHGGDLREVYRLFEPLHRDLARVQGAFAERRGGFARLIHNYGSLTTELADRDGDLTRLVNSSATVFEAFAAEDDNISESIRRFPPALDQTEETLAKVDTLGGVLGPSLESLRPAFRQLDETNAQVLPFVREAAPIIREEIRPFVREARPYVRDLRPAATSLSRALPDLTESFFELNRFFNIAAFNRNGREKLVEGASREDNKQRDEGYLFWLAWTVQNGNSVFSTSDGQGPLRRLFLNASCDTLRDLAANQPGADVVLGVTNLLRDTNLCPGEANPTLPIGGNGRSVPLPKNGAEADPNAPQVSEGQAADPVAPAAPGAGVLEQLPPVQPDLPPVPEATGSTDPTGGADPVQPLPGGGE